ncbi:hypothetical protein VFPFJ_00605 [Purpureocillium lilacinum]|uniref:Uncharacterized protein n=1 Tax=Purpureocillium lilacinum TaxID=33203 RepID=A0A179HVG6_PURLI|nr:hypothetical protein VFPFJ_00605 [Purpureocillium lilacinum]OAQ86534.1 hypothetical protein VFPBJ_00574 [Purpureocillium lilacinum]OAQ94496.1 hypothetical protein VFPFJ_00605 [Purpureocillium lilacinum]
MMALRMQAGGCRIGQHRPLIQGRGWGAPRWTTQVGTDMTSCKSREAGIRYALFRDQAIAAHRWNGVASKALGQVRLSRRRSVTSELPHAKSSRAVPVTCRGTPWVGRRNMLELRG